MKITVLIIEHKHGVNTYACMTKAIANRVLGDYVRDWWETEMDEPCPDPLTPDDIEHYFEEMAEEESYSIDDGELIKE